MADLVQLAKAGNLVNFEKEWCLQATPVIVWSTMTTQQRDAAGQAYNAYRSMGNGNSSTTAPRTLTKEGILNAGSNIKSNYGEMTDSPLRITQLTSLKILTEEIFKQIDRESQLHTDINEKMGITGELSRSYRDSIIETVPAAVRLGFDIKNLTELTTKLAEGSGRFNLISQDTMEKTVVTTRAFGTTMGDMATTMNEFEKIGLGQSDTLTKINDAGRSSLSLGLNSKVVLKEVQTNLSKINEFGFSKGVEGLTRMAQKATEFRMNMSETFKLAEKVMNPESAIELTANMQMLGGAIGDLNDPLKLMYMATNNVEGLQDALHGAAAGLASYNKEQGRFEIVGANLRRAQEMAKTLGVSYQEFAKGAIAANERIAAGEALASRGLDIKDKDREFLINMSQMKGGEMQITIPQSLMDKFGKDFNDKSEVKLSELNQNQLAILKQNRDELEKMNPEDIAKAQFTATKNMENSLKAIAAEVVKGKKNELFGRNEYEVNGKNRNDTIQEGLLPISRLQNTNAKLAETAAKNVLMGFDNVLKHTVDTAMVGVTRAVNVVLMSAFGLNPNDKGKAITDKINNILKGGFQTIGADKKKQDEEEARMKKYYDEGNGKNQRITFNNNLKLTHIGLGDNMSIEKTEKGFLTSIDNWV